MVFLRLTTNSNGSKGALYLGRSYFLILGLIYPHVFLPLALYLITLIYWSQSFGPMRIIVWVVISVSGY